MKKYQAKQFDPESRARRGVLGLAPYAPGKPVNEVRRELGLDNVVKLASNECPMPPHPAIVRAVSHAAADLCRYPDSQSWELKQLVSKKLDTPPESLLFTNGADEAIHLAALAFTNPGNVALIPETTFGAYKTAVILAGGEVRDIPMRADDKLSINLDAMLDAVDERTASVWLCTPNNPSGLCLAAQELQAFLSALPDNVLVVLDEAYCDFVTDPQAAKGLDLAREDCRVLLLRTFSKAYGLGGMRVGFILAQPKIVDVLDRVRLPFSVNAPAQAAAAAALGLEDFVAEHVEHVIAEREFLRDELLRIGCRCERSQTNFVFFRLPETSPGAGELYQELLRVGYVVKPGTVWNRPRRIRLSVGTRQENEGFLAALHDILSR